MQRFQETDIFYYLYERFGEPLNILLLDIRPIAHYLTYFAVNYVLSL